MSSNKIKSIKFRVSFLEYTMIKTKARAFGLKTSMYIRSTALEIPIKQKQLTETDKELFRILAGIGNNLNQIAKKYNQGERLHFELMKTITSIQEITNKLTGNGS